MSSGPKAPTDGFDRAIAGIPSCALDEAGVEQQRTRYACLAPSMTRVEREPEAVLIEFRADFDREMLDRTLAVERECCPFFRFEFDASQRRLRIMVEEAEQLPALDAVAEAFGAAAPGSYVAPSSASRRSSKRRSASS
jgi:hypothetical protein